MTVIERSSGPSIGVGPHPAQGVSRSGSPARRVVVVDAALLEREGLVRVLAGAGHRVAGAVSSLAELGTEPALLAGAEVCVLCVRSGSAPGDDVLGTVLRLRRDHPQLAVLVLADDVDARFARWLVRTDERGVGCLTFRRVTHPADLIGPLAEIAGGAVVVDRMVVRQLLEPLTPVGGGIGALTSREREVVALAAHGLTDRAIASQLGTPLKTVQADLHAVYDKLGVTHDATVNRRIRTVLSWLEAGTG